MNILEQISQVNELQGVTPTSRRWPNESGISLKDWMNETPKSDQKNVPETGTNEEDVELKV